MIIQIKENARPRFTASSHNVHKLPEGNPGRGGTLGRVQALTDDYSDTFYNEESVFVRHAYFLDANGPYKALKAEIDADAWATLNSDTSRPLDNPKSGRIAVKVINHLGDELKKVFRVA